MNCVLPLCHWFVRRDDTGRAVVWSLRTRRPAVDWQAHDGGVLGGQLLPASTPDALLTCVPCVRVFTRNGRRVRAACSTPRSLVARFS